MPFNYLLNYFNGKLYEITIYWDSNIQWNELLQKTTDKYGNPRVNDTGWYCWSDGKTQLSISHSPNTTAVCYTTYDDIEIANAYEKADMDKRKKAIPEL